MKKLILKGVINGGTLYEPSLILPYSDSFIDYGENIILATFKSKEQIDIFTDMNLAIKTSINNGSLNLLNLNTLVELNLLYKFYDKFNIENLLQKEFLQYLVSNIDTRSFFNNPFNTIIHGN